MEQLKTPDILKYQLLVKAVQDLSLAHDLATITEIVRVAAREITGADGATFILKDGDECYYAEENAMEPLWKGKRFPINACISGWVMRHKQYVAISDIYQDDRVPHDWYRPTFVKSLVIVPIRASRPLGAIGNYWSTTHSPSPEELDILQSLANITAVTLENIKTNEELEQRVVARTKELEEVNNELELFSYSVSHDLRAPLRSINGFMSILLEEHGKLLNDDARELADKVVKNANQMTKLIDDLLKFFKAGKKEILKTEIPVTRLITEILEEMKPSYEGRSIEFKLLDLPNCQADLNLLKQVWLNLISNAIKYSAHTSPAIIEIGSFVRENETVYYVKDNGAGFDMNYYSKLFGVFQRLHSPRLFEGNGIGLALVEKIIAFHKGKVWAESKLNSGATFYFTLG